MTSFAERMRQKGNEAYAASAETTSGSKSYVRLEKGRQDLRILMDFDNDLIYLGFRAHSGKSTDDRFQQAVDLSWLARQPRIVERLVASGKLTDESANDIVERGDPATKLFFYLKNAMNMGWSDIRDLSKGDSPGGSPRAYWNVLKADGVAGILETSAGRGSMVAWFEEECKLTSQGAVDLLGHNGVVQVTGTGDKLERSYNYAFIPDREPFVIPDETSTFNLISHLGSRILLPDDKLEFVKRSYRPHLLHAGLDPEDLLGDV